MRYFTLIVGLLFFLVGCNRVEVKKEFYPNGRLKSEMPYKNGKLDGISSEYSKGGRLLIRKHWVDGINDTADYYRQNKESIRVTYIDHRINQITLRNEDGKSISYKQNDTIVFAYSEIDTITIGEKFDVNILLFTPKQDSIKSYRIFIGETNTVNGDMIPREISPISENGKAQYTYVPTQLGKCYLRGEMLSPARMGKKVLSFPFKLEYYVKPKL
jgi:antitoxin component YwqK of YwqJK toxin-antitoxin module